MSGLVDHSIDLGVVLGVAMELLLHGSWDGMKLAVFVLQEGAFLIAPRGVLAVILQPSLFDLWMDLASEATWGGAAFTGGSRCGKAWDPSLVVGNGGMELEVTRVAGGHFSGSHLQVEAK